MSNAVKPGHFMARKLNDFTQCLVTYQTVADTSNRGCSADLCECDRKATECIGTYNDEYNRKHKKSVLANILNALSINTR